MDENTPASVKQWPARKPGTDLAKVGPEIAQLIAQSKNHPGSLAFPWYRAGMNGECGQVVQVGLRLRAACRRNRNHGHLHQGPSDVSHQVAWRTDKQGRPRDHLEFETEAFSHPTGRTESGDPLHPESGGRKAERSY